jgi:hypothetical protein
MSEFRRHFFSHVAIPKIRDSRVAEGCLEGGGFGPRAESQSPIRGRVACLVPASRRQSALAGSRNQQYGPGAVVKVEPYRHKGDDDAGATRRKA